MSLKPYRANMDLTFAAERVEDVSDQIVDALDRIGVQVESASFERMDPEAINPESPLAARLRSQSG